MRPIGTKTISATFLFGLMLGLAIDARCLEMERLLRLSPTVGFCVGLFAVFSGTWLYRLASWAGSSRNYFRLTRDNLLWEGEQNVIRLGKTSLLVGRVLRIQPWELPSALIRFFSFGSCLLIGLLCFNNRTIDLLFEMPQKFSQVGTRYCPPEKPESKKVAEIKPGCELIHRAFKLGYVKRLGSCAPDEPEQKLELCNLRQQDEPYLHYSSRLFMSFFDKFKTPAEELSWKDKTKKAFQAQSQHLEALTGKLAHVVTSAPRSSHHIFTNLPYPNEKLAQYWQEWLDPNGCFGRFRKLPHAVHIEPGDKRAEGKILDHIEGQMLFNPRYMEASGMCKEYTIHWDSPVDTCEKLAKSPEEFLDSLRIGKEIRTVMKRIEEEREVRLLGYELSEFSSTSISLPSKQSKSKNKPAVTVSPQTVISFQCLMKSDRSERSTFKSHSFKLAGKKFRAREIYFPANPDTHKIHVDMYKYFSQAMADGFRYTGFLSQERQTLARHWQVEPELLNEKDYPLVHLEYLKSADIFRGNEWVQKREDLLEVYPYYHHLYHFVDLFRQKYRMQRTRL